MKPSDKITQEFIEGYDQYADGVFRYCFFKLSNRESAKDIVQETFVKTWQYIREGKDIGNLKAFLYKVARNLVIDEYRKQKTGSLDDLQEGGFDVATKEDMTVSTEVDIVFEAVEKLEPHYREVIVMRFVHDLSPKEIADILGENENAVSVRLNRAVKKTQDLLQIDKNNQ